MQPLGKTWGLTAFYMRAGVAFLGARRRGDVRNADAEKNALPFAFIR
jgi:hypothetical protein